MLWRNSPVYLYLFYVTGLHDPVVLRTKISIGLALGDIDDTRICRDTKSSDTGIMQDCLNTFSRQKVHVIAEMAISIVISIPGGDAGDK